MAEYEVFRAYKRFFFSTPAIAVLYRLTAAVLAVAVEVLFVDTETDTSLLL